jgi:protein SCO1/2
MALRSLSHDEMAQIQPLFISIDPERDTPTKADEYAKYFHPSIIGASTNEKNLKEIAKRYLVIYAKVAMEDSAMKYTMDHSSKIYIVGREGKILSTASHGESAEQLATQLKAALAY